MQCTSNSLTENPNSLNLFALVVWPDKIGEALLNNSSILCSSESAVSPTGDPQSGGINEVEPFCTKPTQGLKIPRKSFVDS